MIEAEIDRIWEGIRNRVVGLINQAAGQYWRVTPVGGFAVAMTAGSDLAEGEVVSILQAGANNTVFRTPISGNENDMPLGAVLADALLGETVWVVVSGRAYVLPEAALTAALGDVMYTSGTTAGRVAQAASTGTAQHWRECGHWIEAGSGAGVKALAVMHFN